MSETDRPATAVSAHRGGGETGRSGTYEAYRSALQAGAEYVEFDVRRTLDGTLVAFHQARPGWGRAVAAVSYARLCDLAGYEVPRMISVRCTRGGQDRGTPVMPTGAGQPAGSRSRAVTCPSTSRADYRWPSAARSRDNFGMTRPAAASRS